MPATTLQMPIGGRRDALEYSDNMAKKQEDVLREFQADWYSNSNHERCPAISKYGGQFCLLHSAQLPHFGQQSRLHITSEQSLYASGAIVPIVPVQNE